jgi:hypothetical protein
MAREGRSWHAAHAGQRSPDPRDAVSLPARDHALMDWVPALYMIRVDGHLGPTALSAFPGMTPREKGTHTVLTGWLDQSALYGVLAETKALGLVLLEVRQMERRGESV